MTYHMPLRILTSSQSVMRKSVKVKVALKYLGFRHETWIKICKWLMERLKAGNMDMVKTEINLT